MRKPKILVVDDSKPILCLLEVVLGKQYEVFAAHDGFNAMSWLMDGNRPDIIISDLQMPNIDGPELIAYLTNSSYYDYIPVLILSGAPEDEIRRYCGKLRVAGIITKPFDPADLLKKVRDTLLASQELPVKNPFLLS